MLHLIWDLDGTLIDSQADILHAVKQALSDSQLDISDCIAPIRIGPPLDVMLRESFSPDILSPEKLKEIICNFRKCYDNSDFTMTTPFSCIKAIIADKNNFVHHIVTNKPDFATERILKKLEWEDIFASVVTPYTDNATRKTKTELFSQVISEHSGAVFAGIGDMCGDCIAAKNNDIPSIGVLWGTGTREELCVCSDYLVNNETELHNVLFKLCV